MSKSVTIELVGEEDVEVPYLDTVYSDGFIQPSASWLRWKDHGEGEIDLSKLPKRVKKIKVLF